MLRRILFLFLLLIMTVPAEAVLISGIVTENVPDATEAEAEAGTEARIRMWSPERIKQAILALGSAASDFLGLSDTPDAYTGQGGKVVAVKVAEDGLEFVEPPVGTDDQTASEVSVTDTNNRTEQTTVEGWLDELAATVAGIVSNVSTALSIGTKTATTLGITSDGGTDDVVLPEATTDEAGLLGAGKFDEIVANTSDRNTPTVFKSNKISLVSPYSPKTNVYKGQLHTHTTNSDGADSPAALVTAYRDAGYHFISITDHDYNTPDPEVSGILFIPGIEESSGVAHITRINTTTNNTGDEQSAINLTMLESGFCFYNHPNYGTPDALTNAKLYSTTGYFGAEIDGANGNAETRIDTWLTTHRRMYMLATDDTHTVTTGMIGMSTMVFADDITMSEIMDNLKRGNFYASNGATISAVSVDGLDITITTDAASTIEFIGSGGTVLQTASAATTSTYSVFGDELYVRGRVTYDSDSSEAWTNPIYVEVNPAVDLAAGGVVRGDLYVEGNIYTGAGGTWNNLSSGDTLTLYVDKTDGYDDKDHGFSVDSGAFKTIQYAINFLPAVINSNVIIYYSAETYTESVSINGHSFSGNYTITIEGPLAVASTGTVDSGVAGSGATQGSITDTGNFGSSDGLLMYFDDTGNGGSTSEYRIIDSDTSDTASIVGTFTHQPVSGDAYTAYDWGGSIGSIYVYGGQQGVVLRNVKIAGVSGRVSVYCYDNSAVQLYNCNIIPSTSGAFRCDFSSSFKAYQCLFGALGVNASIGTLTYNGNSYINQSKLFSNQSSAVLRCYNGGMMSFNDSIIDGIDKTPGSGIYVFGNAGVGFYHPASSGYNVIRNCTKGIYAVQGGVVTGTPNTVYTNNTTDEDYALGATFGYID